MILVIITLRSFHGTTLLIVMPLSGLAIGLVIHFLGNLGEIASIADNIHSRGGRINVRENSSIILSLLISTSAGCMPKLPFIRAQSKAQE